jgi:hypothetical protein
VTRAWLIVGGCPRSGSTMLNLVLNSSPNIRISNEICLPRLLVAVDALFYREDRIRDLPEHHRSKSARETWTTSDIYALVFQRRLCKRAVLDTLYERQFGVNTDLSAIRYFGDKHPLYYREDLDLLRAELQPLKIIHVSRRPADVVNSMLRRAQNARRGRDSWDRHGTLDSACAEWVAAWNFVCAEQQRAAGSILHLKYEDLVCNPSAELERIAAFLSVEPRFDLAGIHGGPTSPTERVDERVNRMTLGLDADWHLPLEQLVRRVPRLPPPGTGTSRLPPVWKRFWGRGA